MKDIGYNEDIPADVTPTPTPKKSQLAQECTAPVCTVYMAKTYKYTTELNESYVMSLYDGIGCLAHGIKDKFSSLRYTKTSASPWNLTKS